MIEKHDVAAPKSKPWRTAAVVLGLVVLLGAAAWSFDAWLFARLRVIADDTFASGDPHHPHLMVANSEELETYPPWRLAKHLSFSSAQIRSVVCMSLANRLEETDAAAWRNVVPKLLATYSASEDDVVRDCAKRALAALPCIPEEDADAVIAFLADAKLRSISKGMRNTLLAKVHKSQPERLPEIVALSVGWLDSADAEERKSAFYLLVDLAPSCPEALAFYRRAMDAGDPDHIGSRGDDDEIMLRHHPELIDEFVSGNQAQRNTIFEIALRESDERSAVAFALRNGRDPPRSKGKPLLTERHLELVQAQAAESVTQETQLDAAAKTFRYLQHRPNGTTQIMDYARRRNGKFRASAINYLNLSEKEAAGYVRELISWLWENDRDVQEAVLWRLSNDESTDWLRPYKTGPNAPIVVAWRRWVDEHPDRTEFRRYGIAILLQYDPIIHDDDIDRCANIVCRVLSELEKKTEPTKGPVICLEADELLRWIKRNPERRNRPSVRRFLDLHSSLEAKKIVIRFQRQ